MKNFLSKKISLITTSVIATMTPFAFVPLTSCGPSRAIQFANFESYMDNSLMNYLERQYEIQFQWFTVSEMIETKFRDTYDVAIPTGYELSKLYQKGWLQKIDWAAFGIDGVLDANSALTTLYADEAQNAISQMNTMLQAYDEIPDDFNVLEYGVPYFDQSFCFMYKGDQLQFYSAIEPHDKIEGRAPNWADIFYTISPSCVYADRFGGNIGMLDDSKSLYDMAKIVETTEKNYDNPDEWTNKMSENSSVDDLKETFKSLTSKAQNNWYRLSTDSGQIARILADHSDHGYAAALSWSGDALYAAQGAGEYEPYTGDEMHTVKPYGASLDEIDFIVINNKNKENTEKLERIYKAIFDICLDSYKATSEEDLLEQIDDPYSIREKRYKYWSMQNWDTVNYTPMLKNIYQYVSQPTSDYWEGYDEKTRELMTSLITFTKDDTNALFGRPLSALQNSNTHWAWLETRGNL